MGQPVTVLEKPSSNPGILRFETNRSLTGMGHERYVAGEAIFGERPPDVLARRLFEIKGIDEVHVYANVITVDLGSARVSSDEIKSVIENLHTYYLPGVEVPAFEG